MEVNIAGRNRLRKLRQTEEETLVSGTKPFHVHCCSVKDTVQSFCFSSLGCTSVCAILEELLLMGMWGMQGRSTRRGSDNSTANSIHVHPGPVRGVQSGNGDLEMKKARMMSEHLI